MGAMNRMWEWNNQERSVSIEVDSVTLAGNLAVPKGAKGVVLLAHGVSRNQHSSSDRYLTERLYQARLATLLIDLLTPDEEAIDLRTKHHFRFDVSLLAARIVGVADWLIQNPTTRNLKIGYFSAGVGSGAALVAAADRPEAVSAIVCCGGQTDLASALSRVRAPTLLVVEENIWEIDVHQETLMHLNTEKKMEIIPGVTHLFEEPGVLSEVTRSASQWFMHHLTAATQPTYTKSGC